MEPRLIHQRAAESRGVLRGNGNVAILLERRARPGVFPEVLILRVYLNEQGVEFAAWRREHPSKPLIMKIQTSEGTVAKAVADATAAIKKDCEKLAALIKK